MTVRRFALLLLIAAASACSSMRPMPCASVVASHPPRNFGQVQAPDGAAVPIYRGGQPVTCGELAYLQSAGIRSILKLNDRGLTIDDSESANARRLGMTILSLPFNAATIGRPATCANVGAALAFMSDPKNWPVYVHCSAGKDRTGYMIGLYEKLALNASSSSVLDELHRYGHTGLRSVLMHQIDRELARDVPACAPQRP